MQNKTEILQPESTYHIYNRANGRENIFFSDDNYQYFLQQYQLYLGAYVDTFCYCLMPNHFHLLIRIKPHHELPTPMPKNLQSFAVPQRQPNLAGLTHPSLTPEKIITQQFSRFFNAYAKGFNKAYGRKGSLFMRNYKRKLVTDENYLKKLVQYIHLNPVDAGLCNTPAQWKWSSYAEIIIGNSSIVRSGEVIEWFSDLENFRQFHLLSSMLNETK